MFTSEQQVIRTLEAAFSQVHQRMESLPFLNPRLQVRALGFQPWQPYWLGVMVTPWFMNLMLLPGDESADVSRVGEAQSVNFPCGTFSFVAGHNHTIGSYLSCSLFSPVQELESQQLAEEVALASLNQLLGSKNPQEEHVSTRSGAHAAPRRQFFQRILGQQINQQGAAKPWDVAE